MKDSVRIVVVGDEKVGKTSIIEVLITEKFQEDVQPVLPVVVVPKDVTPEKVHVSIVDTPGEMLLFSRVEEEVTTADVIVLVYDVNDELSASRISSFWLRKFRNLKVNVPIILVGNKIDERGGMQDPTAAAKMEAFIKPIMDNFREVDVCIECSAKSMSNISEVFYFAQKAVLYPTGNVYDVETHSLKPGASKALRRIFKQCDVDADGGLNDRELNDFQHKCFSMYLKDAELEGVKAVVRDSRPDTGLNADGSLSVDGFIFLHTLFIQKGRLETTWIVLRKFGYDDEMKLSVAPGDLRHVENRRVDQVVELSDDGKQFLSDLFAEADQDCDGLLSPAEFKLFFADYPGTPFEVKDKKIGERLMGANPTPSKEVYITLDALIARWELYVNDSVKDAIVTLKYLGYSVDGVSGAVRVSEPRFRERRWRRVAREVINIAVVGDNGVMNTDIVRGLADRDAGNVISPGIAAASMVELSVAEKKTLIMRDVPMRQLSETLESRSMLDQLDIVCVVFDGASMSSYEYALSVWEAINAKKDTGVKLPVVFVACVGGDSANGSDVLDKADTHCLENDLPTPTRVSLVDGEYADLYTDLLGVALYPSISCPDYYAAESSTGRNIMKVSLGLAVTGVMLYGAKALYDYYKKKPASG